jgi:hypothetical protein
MEIGFSRDENGLPFMKIGYLFLHGVFDWSIEHRENENIHITIMPLANKESSSSAKEETCKHKREGEYARWPHGNVLWLIAKIAEYPYCQKCGKRIEVVE